MIKKWKSFNLSDKIILLIFMVSYIIFTIQSLIFFKDKFAIILDVGLFLILILWLIIYNNFEVVRKLFQKNKVKIYMTLFVALLLLFLLPNLFSDFNSLFRSFITGYLVSCVFVELYNYNLINNEEAVLCMLGIFSFPLLISGAQILGFILILISTYISVGITQKLLTKVKSQPDLIVNLIGILLAIATLIVELINK